MFENKKQSKKKIKSGIILVNHFYYGLSWLIFFSIINFIIGFFTLLETFINFVGITLIIILIWIKEGGIKYDIKR